MCYNFRVYIGGLLSRGGYRCLLWGKIDYHIFFIYWPVHPMKLLLNKIFILVVSILLLAFLAACGIGKNDNLASMEGTYPVDPLFRKFYQQVGGRETLGPAITPIFEHESIFYQYTIGALMMYDPQYSSDQRFRLAPLGLDMGVYEVPVPIPDQVNGRYVDGHVIDEKFVPLYERMGGRSVVGKPLTEVYKNADKNRYEQYFENIGFYWIEGDASDAVYLLAYGAWKCEKYCRASAPENSSIQLPSRFAEPFVKTVARLGLDFTGLALTPPYLAPEGQLEQTYENIVLVIHPSQPEIVRLLPVPERVGIERDVLMPALREPDLYFYPYEEELGYNIPASFMEYIQAHAGIDFVGIPLTQMIQLDDGTFQQCFVNLCLQGQRGPNGSIEVSPLPLGEKYRDLFYDAQASVFDAEAALDITIQIWEGFPMVSPNQKQEIGVVIYGNGRPLSDLEPVLELSLPDSVRKSYTLPPTDEKGETQLILDPLEADNGTLVPYKVCLSTQNEQMFCVMDSYLIWKADYITVNPETPDEYMSYFPFVLKNYQVYIPAVLENFTIYLPLTLSGN